MGTTERTEIMETTRYYPAKGGGKYHRNFLGTAACRRTVELDTSLTAPILHEDGDRPHPIICRTCLKEAK